jgi:zinc transporter 1
MKKFAALIIVGILTMIYSLSELALFGYIKSVAMLTDGLHNLSDVIQLSIAYIALKKSSSGKTDKFTYGWKRTEIVGALMNACFLLSLCIYIFVESLRKYLAPASLFQKGLEGYIFIGVAGGGILVNGLGTIIFALLGGHGHSHGGHGHSHGGGHGHAHGKGKKHKKEERSLLGDDKINQPGEGASVFIEKKGNKDLNMSAVFLHYLGDSIASSLLLATGLLAYFFDGQGWTYYLDPTASILIAIMLLWSAVPLTKECVYLLLQQVPNVMKLSDLRKQLSLINYLQGYHDLHVWQLSDDITIGTIHACVYDTDVAHIETVKEEVKKVFHEYDIHSTTVQMEILSAENEELPFVCKQNCKSFCTHDWCCKGSNNAPPTLSSMVNTVELMNSSK